MMKMVQNQATSRKKLVGISTAAGNISCFYHLKLTVFVSLLAWPVTYIFDNGIASIDQTARPFWMMASGFIILFLVVAGVAKYSYVHNWIYYGAVLFAFTAVIDLIITLEFNGLIHNFMSEYLKLGEPYLASSWGSAIALFDATGFYLMYLVLVYLVSNGRSWRSLGIYYGSAILNSMVVLILGVFTGRHSSTLCTFFNVPYAIYPLLLLLRAFRVKPGDPWITSRRAFTVKVLDFLLAVALVGCTVIVIGKGIIALSFDRSINNSSIDYFSILKHEPSLLLDDPAPFAGLQAIVHVFYVVPIQSITIFSLLSGWMPAFLWETTLIHAGIMIQSQFAVIGSALDPQTPNNYKSNWMDEYFWFYNLLAAIVPHCVMLRLLLQHGNKKLGKNL